MPSTTFRAFVSSTFEDLKDHRAYVIRSLRKPGIDVDPMEDWAAEPDEPKKFSQARLTGCDFCVLLVALRRGYVPKGEYRSITQLEYDAALDKGIDILVFLLDENAPWPHRFVELDKDPSLSEWRRSLEERHGRQLFGLNPSTIEIAPAITRWVEKQSRKAITVGEDWIQLVSNLLDLPRNQPETWAVAARLLPHALEAVQRAYTGDKTKEPPVEVGETGMSQPTKTLLAGARTYFNDSKARHERTCFVLMPLGRKMVAGREVDFDRIYRDIYEPAISDVKLPGSAEKTLIAQRLDQVLDTDALVDMQMYHWLEYSRIVIADITGLNPNVFYELGHRHRARESGTLIFRQAGAQIPFDMRWSKTFQYWCTTPAEVDASRQLIRDVLRYTLDHQRIDSPAHLALQRTHA